MRFVLSVQNAGMVLRAYREEDFEAVYALDRVCFRPRFRFSRAMMRRVVGAPGAVVLLAWEGEALVGFCAAEVEREGEAVWGYLATLDVAPASRGRGIARELMRAVEEEVAGKGAEGMVLHVFVGNAAAVGLYEGIGYERVGREVGFYGRGFDAWVYRKALVRLGGQG